MKTNKKIFITLTMIFLLSSCFLMAGAKVQNRSTVLEQKLSVKDMKTDVNYLLSYLSKYQQNMVNHPNAYKVVINKINKEIEKPMTKEEFFWDLNDLFIALKDGHSAMNIFDYDFMDCLDIPPLIWTNDGLIVRKNQSGLLIGDQIISIGGKSSTTILEEMNSIIPAEIPEWVKANINYLEYGWVLRRLRLVNENEKVVVEYKRNDVISKVELSFYSSVIDLIKNLRDSNKDAQNTEPHWTIYKSDDLGVIKFDTCTDSSEYQEAFKQFFNDINNNNIHNIAVDLRDNGGGSDAVINLFLSFTKVKQYMGLYSDSPVTRYINPDEIRKVSKDDPPPFSGEIFVLTSNRTFSAATDFAIILKANNIAKIIGQSPGNIPSFYGNVREGVLPITKFSFSYSTSRFKAPLPEDEQNKAIAPDYVLDYSKEDIINNIDPWLNEAKQLSSKP